MYPSAIVEQSIVEKLDIIAVCDHNASENLRYVIKAAEGRSLTVLPGMEVASSEEVHVLALFDNLDEVNRLQEIVYRNLSGSNREEIFGCQAIVNDEDEVEGFNDRLLIGATKLSLLEITHHIHNLGGLVIASHIDRESFSVISQLGFVDSNIPFDALEVTPAMGIQGARIHYPELSSYPLIEASDAHSIRDIGKGVTKLILERGTISEIKMAFENRSGRYVQV
jgi:PHP family Zn ribbon phosphoesterase